jgi:HD-like signal output (HDOD) protein
MTQLTEILRTLRTMPPLPHVAQRVLETVRDPDYSIDGLVALVRTDPSLTARILKLCNSALYGLSTEVTTVSNAVAYLGTRNLVKLVLVSCAANHFTAAGSSQYTEPRTLWRHTFACAIACQWLANRCGYPQSDAAFTAGILHNIGKVALSQVASDSLLISADVQGSHADVERAIFGIDHATAAGVVVDAWGLPRELRRAVRCHHDDADILGESPLPAILNLADTLVLTAGIGNPFPHVPLTIAPTVLDRLHLTMADAETATAHVAAEIERSAELLNLGMLVGR